MEVPTQSLECPETLSIPKNSPKYFNVTMWTNRELQRLDKCLNQVHQDKENYNNLETHYQLMWHFCQVSAYGHYFAGNKIKNSQRMYYTSNAG